jgi:glycerol kinase
VRSYLGALDQGTSSTRFIVFDRRGTPIASAQREHRSILPRAGWVEHDPREIWSNCIAVARSALVRAGLTAADLAAVGITNQRETALLWNRRTGEPLHHAIVWQDTRVDRLVAEYARRGTGELVRAKTGLPLASYFSALKLKWLLDEVAGARALAQAGDALFGTVDSWLLWQLSGGPHGGLHLTDVTNASRTQLMSLETLDWDPQLLELFDVPRAALARIVASSALYGEARIPELAGVPLAGMLGDQQAALVGQACFRPGDAKNTYGTGCFVLMNTGERPAVCNAGLVTTVAYRLGEARPCYALEGSIAVAGALVQWLRNNLQMIGGGDDIETLARSAPDNGGVYFVPAFSGLFAPHWNRGARGTITGLTHHSNRAHLARAALEATAYQTRDVLAAMAQEGGVAMQELRVDGGMVVNELLMQFQADILDASVVRPRVVETTALGAAYAAGLAVGYWSGLDELAANWEIERRWTPAMDAARRELLLRSWRRAVDRSLDWAT